MKWKEKDDLSWCCINRRRSYDDGDSKDANNQTTNAVLMERSTKEASLLVEKVKKKQKRKKKRKERKHKNIFASFPSSPSFSSCFSYLRSLIMTTHHHRTLHYLRKV
jgi:hypothetical protein